MAKKAEEESTVAFEGFFSTLKLITDDFQTEIVAAGIRGAVQIANTVKEYAALSIASLNVSKQITGITEAALFAKSMQDMVHDRQREIIDKSFEETRKLGDIQLNFAEGRQMSAAMMYTSYADLSKNFVDVMKADAGLVTRGTDAMTSEMMVNFNQAANAFSLSQITLTEVTRRELSKTGKITGDMLLDLQATMLATSAASGESMEKISSDVQLMLNDFTKFGMMTMNQMGSMSAAVGQMGISMGDVGMLVSKFQSFDSATSAMSNLAAATGVTLDTMELFKLANTDPEGFARSLKQQLSDQGLVYEEMNFIQKKLTSQALGIDPQKLEALLNDQLSAADSIAGTISEKAAGYGKDEVKSATDKLVDYSKVFNRTAEQADAAARSMAQMKTATLESASAVNNLSRILVATTEELTKSLTFAERKKQAAKFTAAIQGEVAKEDNTRAMVKSPVAPQPPASGQTVPPPKTSDAPAPAAPPAVVTPESPPAAPATQAQTVDQSTQAALAAAHALLAREKSFDTAGSGIGANLKRLKVESAEYGRSQEDFTKLAEDMTGKSVSQATLEAFYKDGLIDAVKNDYLTEEIENAATGTAEKADEATKKSDGKATKDGGSQASNKEYPPAPININLNFTGNLSSLASALVATNITLPGVSQPVHISTTAV